ncbi:MAG: RNA polymerase sigma factor [Pirellulaceae bacterium]|nr:RNA polymerase sigma factor [Pirellulaceae bacterium]
MKLSINSDLDVTPRQPDLGLLAEDNELLGIFIATKSRAAAEQLIERHGPMVAGVIRRMICDSKDAEDAYQATFLIFLQSAKKIRNQTSLAAWLYGVAYRTAYRVRRRSQRLRAASLSDATCEPTQINNPLEKIAREMELELLDRELNALHPPLREALIEHYVLGFSAPQIADRLDISLSAVEGRLRRGRSSLRQRLARRGISFTVSLAAAAVYQSNCVAAVAQTWQQGFLQSDLFSHAVSANSPSIPLNLQQLVQGEIAMKSLSFKVATLTAMAASLIVSVSGLPYLLIGDGNKPSQSLIVSSAFGEQLATAEATLLLADAPPAASTPTDANKFASDPFSDPFNDSPISGKTRLNSKNATSQVVDPKLALAQSTTTFTMPTGPAPNWMTDGGTLAQEEAQLRERVRSAIRKKVKPDFNNTPLRSVLETFALELNLAILIDTVALELDGTASPEDPVTLQGVPEMSLQRALHLILDPKELTILVEPDYVMVTTKSSGSGNTLRYYDLAHFLPNIEKVPEIIRLIETMIQADWVTTGGECVIQCFGSVLVVSCPEYAHRDIEGLLYELSKMDPANLKAVSNNGIGFGGQQSGGMGGGGMGGMGSGSMKGPQGGGMF